MTPDGVAGHVDLTSAAVLSAADLDALPWAYTTGRFQAHGHRFAVRSTSAGIGRYVDELYRSCAADDGGVATCYSIVDVIPGRWPHALYVDGDRLYNGARAAPALNRLTWHVNQRAIASGGELVLVHAAAAARDGIAVVLPAATESGKTTLVAGLARAGFSYLTDEATGIHPDTLEVHGYPKPFSVDRGSWEVLADLCPDVGEGVASYLEDQWQVAPGRLQPGAHVAPLAPTLIVFPRYEPGARTSVEPVPRARALVTMLEQTFRFHEDGARNLEVLARFVERCACFHLVSGDLTGACDAIGDLVDAARPQRVAAGGPA